VELLGEDIRYIKTGDLNLKKNKEFFLTSLCLPEYMLLLPAAGTAIAYRRREQKFSGNTAFIENRRANKEATRRLKKANNILLNTTAKHSSTRSHGQSGDIWVTS